MDPFDKLTLGLVITFLLLWRMFRVVPMRELAVRERLGKFAGIMQPGLHFLIPLVDRIAYVHDAREQVIDIPKQRCITKDNVEVDVDGLVYLKVMDAQKASYGIGNYRTAVISLAQTTMRSEIGKLDLDDTFREREKVNEKIVHEIDRASEPWGIKFIRYEIRNINPSANMMDTMEKQMEAERKKRADITLAQGAKEARINISEGEKQESINISEGEKQKRINEAEGKAREIEFISQATAKGIEVVAKELNTPGGNLAMKNRILENFILEYGKILESAEITVVPAKLAEIQGFFKGLGEVTNTMTGDKGGNA